MNRRAMNGRILLAACWLSVLVVVPSRAADDPVAGTDELPPLTALRFRSIGPAVMGGRIADIAAIDADHFYVGTASGNLWRTTNRGTTWEPLFEDGPVSSIGDVAIAPSNPRVLYLGTGEANNRQSSPWGAGVYRSADSGRTWTHVGLTETRHVGRIRVHPSDPNTAWVAAAGNLWAASSHRGVYRTRDGGRSWQRVLFVDEDTGAIDLTLDPSDPNVLIAAMYQRRRSACCFVGGGPGSGLYRSRDGGDTWEKLSRGLPAGNKGRIGLDTFRGNGDIVYAVIEAERGSGVYRSDDGGTSWQQRSDTNPRPMYFSQVRVDPVDPDRVYVLGQRLYVSDDGGRTFRDDGAPNVHLDHHALWIDPSHPAHLLLGSDGGLSISFDRGASWRFIDNLPIGQFYEVGFDDADPYMVYGGLQDNGSWGGPSASLDGRGIRNADWFNINGGDGFYARVDPDDRTILYAESQNGSVVRVDRTTMERQSIRPLPRPDRDRVGRAGSGEPPPDKTAATVGRYRFNWNSPLVVSSHDSRTLYLGANVLFVSHDRGLSWQQASPDLTRAIDRDQEVLMGIKPVRGVLSGNDGISAYGTITTINESPVHAGLLYVGTDDGKLQRTRDGGISWSDLSDKIVDRPPRAPVSRVVASAVAGRVYVSFDNHYAGDFAPYVYVSDDDGEHWRKIVQGLPNTSVNVILEHPRTPSLLFLGNELGLYVSVDSGRSWARLKSNLPTVPVDDLAVQPRANDLIVATHGRSLWILDDATPLETIAQAVRTDVYLFPVRAVTERNLHTPQQWTGAGEFRAPNPPAGAIVRYWLSAGAVRSLGPGEGVAERKEPVVQLHIRGDEGLVRTLQVPAAVGLQQVVWDLRTEPPLQIEKSESKDESFRGPPGIRVPPGRYELDLVVGDTVRTTPFHVLLDPRVKVDPASLRLRQLTMRKAWEFAGPYQQALRAISRIAGQVDAARQQVESVPSASEQLSERVHTLTREVGELRRQLLQDRRVLFAALSVERATSRPTDDQIAMIDRARASLPDRIEHLNALIAQRLPALYDQMNQEGIRPDPGPTVKVPDWRR